MRTSGLLFVTVISIILPQSVVAQALFDSSSTNGMAAGLGAGLAASLGRGQLAGKTYRAGANATMSAAQALQVQTKAIDQYMKLGMDYEAKKQWQNAEKSYRYVLQVSALRDGPISTKMLPTLQHLSDVSSAQGNVFDAISFEQRVVGLTKNLPVPDPANLIASEIKLSNLYLEKHDYSSAEPVLKESYDLSQKPSIPEAKKKLVAHNYASLLRKMNKMDDADRVEMSVEGLKLPSIVPDSSLPPMTQTSRSTVPASPQDSSLQNLQVAPQVKPPTDAH